MTLNGRLCFLILIFFLATHRQLDVAYLLPIKLEPLILKCGCLGSLELER
jgi:hypothetical protein